MADTRNRQIGIILLEFDDEFTTKELENLTDIELKRIARLAESCKELREVFKCSNYFGFENEKARFHTVERLQEVYDESEEFIKRLGL